MRSVPAASVLMRLLGFMVPCLLALAGVQPLIGAAAGAVGTEWAVGMSLPALVGAVVIFVAGRLFDRGNALQPPWYSAWVLLPGAFVVLITWLGARFALEGRITPGQLVACYGYAAFLVGPLGTASAPALDDVAQDLFQATTDLLEGKATSDKLGRPTPHIDSKLRVRRQVLQHTRHPLVIAVRDGDARPRVI